MPPEPCIIASAYSFQLDKFLDAWAQVQSGNYADAEGPHGELGLYQIKQDLWEKHCKLPFRLALQPSNSRVVFIRIVCDYLLQAKSTGCSEAMLPEVITFWLACGRNATVANKWKRDEIERVLNLYGR